METPVLSKKQQKKALSSKKQALKSIRNVLVQPFEKYWPLVDGPDEEMIIQKLNEFLPAVKRPKVKMPLLEKKKLSKEEYKAKILKLSNEQIKPPRNIIKTVMVGINEVTRCMEKSNPTCVLISGTIDPVLLTNHICTLASLKRIPLLVINNLENILKSILSFKAITIAFKCDNEEDHFKPLCNVITDISMKFPITNQNCTSDNSSYEIIKTQDIAEVKTSDYKQNEQTVTHLIRLTNNIRAFIPPRSQENITTITKDFGDFISINNKHSEQDHINDSNSSTVGNDKILNFFVDKQSAILNKNSGKKLKNRKHDQVKRKYIPLKVKRIQGSATKNKSKKKNIQKKENK